MKLKYGPIIFSLLVVVGLLSCWHSSSYLNFTNQSQAYYQKVAAACDEVRFQFPAAMTNQQKIMADSIALPAVLKNLHPIYLVVSSNRVCIAAGVGRGGYGIIWQSGGLAPPYWELRTSAEGLDKLLYTGQVSIQTPQ